MSNIQWQYHPSFQFCASAHQVDDDGSQPPYIFWCRFLQIGCFQFRWYSQYENFREHASVWIMTRNYKWAPAPIWFLFISPLMTLAGMGSPWFVWPVGQSKNPFKKSFWRKPDYRIEGYK